MKHVKGADNPFLVGLCSCSWHVSAGGFCWRLKLRQTESSHENQEPESAFVQYQSLQAILHIFPSQKALLWPWAPSFSRSFCIEDRFGRSPVATSARFDPRRVGGLRGRSGNGGLALCHWSLWRWCDLGDGERALGNEYFSWGKLWENRGKHIRYIRVCKPEKSTD